jgi:hypothetical protein
MYGQAREATQLRAKIWLLKRQEMIIVLSAMVTPLNIEVKMMMNLISLRWMHQVIIGSWLSHPDYYLLLNSTNLVMH